MSSNMDRRRRRRRGEGNPACLRQVGVAVRV
jgi:hypothetical protein